VDMEEMVKTATLKVLKAIAKKTRYKTGSLPN